MLSKELAQKLKEAGFKQYGNGYCHLKNGEDYFYDTYDKANEYNDSLIISYVPTLSELIEECGDEFGGLHRDTPEEDWFALTFSGIIGDIYGKGSSVEEAVAKLWLEINNK